MRMPLMDFLLGGDPKFMIAITILFVIVLVQFIRRRKEEDHLMIDRINKRIGHLSIVMIMLSVISLLLGLLHSFYFMGAVSGIAPNLMFSGISRMLITPTYGLILFTLCRLLLSFSERKLSLSKS